MKLFFTSPFIVAAAMLLLLPLLAWLQYHWLGQLSASEGEQMKTRLRAVASRLGQDFDQELARAYLAFAAGAQEASANAAQAYAACYDRWLETAAYPGLVKAVWLAQPRQQSGLQLHQLNRPARSFTAQAWPSEMVALGNQLEEQVRSLRNAGPLPLPDIEARLRETTLDDEPPALVLPLLEFDAGRDNRFGPTADLAGFLIVTLDLIYIQQQVLPALAARTFIAIDGPNYELAVVSRDERRIIYQLGSSADYSSGALNGSSKMPSAPADSSAALFSLRADDLRNLTSNRGGRFGSNPPRPGPASGPRPDFAPAGEPRRFTPLRALETNDQLGLWQVQIRHRAGSLAAAVASVRRRNLLISFGILALLAGSVVLLVASARRARWLAARQMDFVAGVSHELRTPLTVIGSAAYNLDRGIVKDPQQIKHYGALIRKETDRLKEMVEQVLEFAGVQAGRQTYDLRPTVIERVVDEAVAATQPLLSEGGFQIDVDVAPNLPPIEADATALARALQNLVNNAMKYSGASRWIGVRAAAVTEGNAEIIQITVSDRGLGIPATELAHVFEPFYRGSEARAAQIRGNGLGLSLVKNIITAHRGRISAQSAPGAGSTFVISLPALAASDEPASLGRELSYE